MSDHAGFSIEDWRRRAIAAEERLRAIRVAIGTLAAEGVAVDAAGPTSDLLGDRVRGLREHLGFSQANLARAMTERGFAWYQATVHKIEFGLRSLRFDEAVGLAAILGVSVGELANEDGPDRDDTARTEDAASSAKSGGCDDYCH